MENMMDIMLWLSLLVVACYAPVIRCPRYSLVERNPVLPIVFLYVGSVVESGGSFLWRSWRNCRLKSICKVFSYAGIWRGFLRGRCLYFPFNVSFFLPKSHPLSTYSWQRNLVLGNIKYNFTSLEHLYPPSRWCNITFKIKIRSSLSGVKQTVDFFMSSRTTQKSPESILSYSNYNCTCTPCAISWPRLWIVTSWCRCTRMSAGSNHWSWIFVVFISSSFGRIVVGLSLCFQDIVELSHYVDLWFSEFNAELSRFDQNDFLDFDRRSWKIKLHMRCCIYLSVFRNLSLQKHSDWFIYYRLWTRGTWYPSDTLPESTEVNGTAW